MKNRDFSTGRVLAALFLILTAAAFSGCTVGSGYSGRAYYSPSYASYYGDYGYAGDPYWGGGPYVGSAIVIGGRSHRGYYGGHHYSHDWSRGAASIRSGPAVGRGRGGASVSRGGVGGGASLGGGRGPR